MSIIDEWKKKINLDLSSDTFEEMCYFLIKSLKNFYNVDWKHGADGGRDLEANYRTKIEISEINEIWRFECKNYKDALSEDLIMPRIARAFSEGIDALVILSNNHLSTPLKEAINKSKFKIKIIDWAGEKFLELLVSKPHIFNNYFPSEEIPKIFSNAEDKERLIELPKELGKKFGININYKLSKKYEIDKNNPEPELINLITNEFFNLNTGNKIFDSYIFQLFGSILLSLKDYNSAINFIDKSINLMPDNVDALLNKAFILAKKGEFGESNNIYNQIIKKDSSNVYAKYNIINNLFLKGELDEAYNLINELLKKNGNFLNAILLKINILIRFNDYPLAIKYLEEKLIELPNNKDLLHKKAEIYLLDLDLKKSLKIINDLLIKYPNDVTYINTKGRIYEFNGIWSNKKEIWFKESIKEFKKSIQINKNFEIGWANLMVSLINLNEIEESEKILNELPSSFFINPFILHRKSLLEKAKGNITKALELINESLKYNFDTTIVLTKAELLIIKKDYPSALNLLSKLEKFSKKESDIYLLRSIIFKNQHKTTLSKIQLKKSKEYKKEIKSLL